MRCSLGYPWVSSLYRRFERACLTLAFGTTSGMHKRCAAHLCSKTLDSSSVMRRSKDLNNAHHFEDCLGAATSAKVSGQVSRAIPKLCVGLFDVTLNALSWLDSLEPLDGGKGLEDVASVRSARTDLWRRGSGSFAAPRLAACWLLCKQCSLMVALPEVLPPKSRSKSATRQVVKTAHPPG